MVRRPLPMCCSPFSMGSSANTIGRSPSNQIVPEIVRIGVGNARIRCVTTQQAEYLDEARQECLVDLEDSNRNYNQLHNEDEGDFVLLTSEEGTGDLSSRYVGGASSYTIRHGSSLRTRDAPDLSLGLHMKPVH